MVDNDLFSQDGLDLSRDAVVATLDDPAPDISQVAIAAARPLGGAGILDVQTGVEGHAVRGGLRPVDGAFALVPDGRRNGLPGQQHGVDIGLAGGEHAVGNESEEQSQEAGRVGIPLASQAGEALVDGFDETHGWVSARG